MEFIWKFCCNILLIYYFYYLIKDVDNKEDFIKKSMPKTWEEKKFKQNKLSIYHLNIVQSKNFLQQSV